MPTNDKDHASSHPRSHMMVVRWISGREMIDLGAILANAARTGERITTIEMRDDGRLVEYGPTLQRHDGEHFSLIYDDRGRWNDGGDADGVIGEANFTLENTSEKKKVTCAWTPRESEDRKARPRCIVHDVEKQRALALAMRTVRDRQFRRTIFGKEPCCVITGETEPSVLDAAHVLPVHQGGSDLADNGIVLRKDLHALFDANILRLHADGHFTMFGPVLSSYGDYPARLRQQPSLRNDILEFIRPNIVARNSHIT